MSKVYECRHCGGQNSSFRDSVLVIGGCDCRDATEADVAADERLATGKAERVIFERANVLLVGDTVNLFADQPGAPFGWGTVVAVTHEFAEVVRPYVHLSSASVSLDPDRASSISYLGQELTKLPRDSNRLYHIVFRTTVPE